MAEAIDLVDVESRDPEEMPSGVMTSGDAPMPSGAMGISEFGDMPSGRMESSDVPGRRTESDDSGAMPTGEMMSAGPGEMPSGTMARM